MYTTHLEIFAQIDGIGAASGLFLIGDLLYIIGDNSGYLNVYNIKTKALNKIQILFNDNHSLENIPKANKPDFEVLCSYKNILYILGSGSTSKRNLMIEYALETKSVVQKDLSKLYDRLKSISSIDDENFNIEGTIFNGAEWLLFNRGNGIATKNGIFRIGEKDLENADKIRFFPSSLPKINHVEASFTDAILYQNEIFFIATAEDTKSTYHDGEVLGSFIGSINLESLKINFTHKISDSHKFEGISFLNQTENKIEFLLCEDRDTEELNATVYKLTLNFKPIIEIQDRDYYLSPSNLFQ